MLTTRRKWTFRSADSESRLVVTKKENESGEHVLMKALLWALYLPRYPGCSVEVPVGGRYKPDVVSIGALGALQFWGEAGHVGRRKLETLLRRYRSTHFAFAKWASHSSSFATLVRRAIPAQPRSSPVDLIVFPADSYDRFVDEEGTIHIRLAEVSLDRIP